MPSESNMPCLGTQYKGLLRLKHQIPVKHKRDISDSWKKKIYKSFILKSVASYNEMRQ